MKLRTQVGLMLIVVFGCLVAASTIVQLRVIYPSFKRLEASLAKTDANRCVQAIDRELEHVIKFSIDWGVWNDMYQFSQDGNQDFRQTNLANRDYFQQINMPVMFVCDNDGRIVHRHTFDPVSFEPIDLPQFPADRLSLDHPLMRPASLESLSGIFLTDLGPLLVSSRAILKSDESGPARGRFIAGRFLDSATLDQLSTLTAVNFKVWSTAGPMPDDIRQRVPFLRETFGEALVHVVDPEQLQSLRLLPTIEPDQSLIVDARVPRRITAQGATTIRFGLLSLLFVAGCIVLGLIWMLQTRIVAPIVALRDHASGVAASGDLTARLKLGRTDEIGTLAGAFDRMIERLEETQSSLTAASRQAGMAEAAAGVLHNVGNAMTNASVTVSQLQHGIEQSRSAALAKVAGLLREHQHDLAAFLTADTRGRQLPEYLERLDEAVGQERTRLADDARRLQASLDHISEIVRAQQGMVVAPEVLETTRLSHIITQAAMLVRPSFDRHKVRLAVRVQDDRVVLCDRARLQQVLVNLLTNGLQAVKPTEGERRAVEVSAGDVNGERYWIEVRDTGMGFDPQQHQRLFHQGFTTRPGGHGLGLHYCAVAVRQMGGSITAKSDGPGRGASFRIDLPQTAAQMRQAA